MFSVAAIDAAGLAETLSGDGTFTVFAPNDDAFDKIPAELVAKLLDPIWQPQLQDVSVVDILQFVTWYDRSHSYYISPL